MTLSYAAPGIFYGEDSELPPHTSLTYRDVMAMGPPAQPLEFPTPTVHRAVSVSSLVLDHHQHSNSRVYEIHNALTSRQKWEKQQQKAYLFKKNIAKTTFGCIKLCVVLLRRHADSLDGCDGEAEWILTDELVAIKASSKSKMRQHRGHHLKDPMKEAATLQYVGSYHGNVLGCLEVLHDAEYLYIVMPYCLGGDLYSMVRKGGCKPQKHLAAVKAPPSSSSLSPGMVRSSSDKSLGTTITSHSNTSTNTRRPEEMQARIWFRQLLEALMHLQKKGICHNDLTLENLLLDENNNLVLIDFGRAIRVPYADRSNYGGVCDVSEGTGRLLVLPQGRSGNLTYLAPEILEGDEAFDGFAADLWSAGVVLFVLLVGLAPFKWPNSTDVRYAQINRGKLKDLMFAHLEHPVSDDACDLLQNMLWRDPRQRLTMAQILQHPWVVGQSEEGELLEPDTSGSSKFGINQILESKVSPKLRFAGSRKHTVHFDYTTGISQPASSSTVFNTSS